MSDLQMMEPMVERKIEYALREHERKESDARWKRQERLLFGILGFVMWGGLTAIIAAAAYSAGH